MCLSLGFLALYFNAVRKLEICFQSTPSTRTSMDLFAASLPGFLCLAMFLGAAFAALFLVMFSKHKVSDQGYVQFEQNHSKHTINQKM